MTKFVACVTAALLAASCGKKTDDASQDKAGQPAAGGSAAPAAPAGGGGAQALSIDLLKIEVDAPPCAKVMSQDANQATVVAAGGNGCTGLALTFNNMGNQPETYDNELKILTNGLAPEFSRKDKTADGWIFSYKLAVGGDEPRLHVIGQFKAIQCVGETNLSDTAGAAAMEHTCASMRAKK